MSLPVRLVSVYTGVAVQLSVCVSSPGEVDAAHAHQPLAGRTQLRVALHAGVDRDRPGAGVDVPRQHHALRHAVQRRQRRWARRQGNVAQQQRGRQRAVRLHRIDAAARSVTTAAPRSDSRAGCGGGAL